MLRSHVDRWVVQLIAKQFLLEAHFSRSEKYPCVLGKAGRAIYYEQLETQMKTWRRMLRLLAHRWAERVLQSMPEA
jgi:CRISPR-associated protein Cas1